MMDGIRQYVFSVICAGMACALFKALFGSSATAKTAQVLCGTFMIFTFLMPLKHIDLQEAVGGSWWDEEAVEEAVQSGEALAQNAMADIISQEICSYIEKKAAVLGAEIEAEVSLSDERIPVPVSVTIIGQVSPYIRKQLEACISEDIGIGREDIRWTGLH